MEFKHIEYFVKASEFKSMSQAAEALFISQQALSKCMQNLETELGCKLFERHIIDRFSVYRVCFLVDIYLLGENGFGVFVFLHRLPLLPLENVIQPVCLFHIVILALSGKGLNAYNVAVLVIEGDF